MIKFIKRREISTNKNGFYKLPVKDGDYYVAYSETDPMEKFQEIVDHSKRITICVKRGIIRESLVLVGGAFDLYQGFRDRVLVPSK